MAPTEAPIRKDTATDNTATDNTLNPEDSGDPEDFGASEDSGGLDGAADAVTVPEISFAEIVVPEISIPVLTIPESIPATPTPPPVSTAHSTPLSTSTGILPVVGETVTLVDGTTVRLNLVNAERTARADQGRARSRKRVDPIRLTKRARGRTASPR